MKFSNPRTTAVFEDWPFGGSQRCRMEFKIESHPTRGERCIRTSTTANNRVGKPKKSTYSTMCRIVDGDDGKTYILEYNQVYRMIHVRESNLKYSFKTAYPGDPDYDELWKMLYYDSSAVSQDINIH